MARIRSVHPGLWTDEAFVCASPLARLLFIGIWNECDDMGSFEWSPLKLKMRILPADNGDVNELLAELEANGCIRRYELEGRQLGAVRNFAKFQRPKKPNSLYPQTDAIRQWVGTEARSTRDGSEPLPHQSGTPSEISRQMEDGGDKMEDGGEKEERGKGASAARTPAPEYSFAGKVIRLDKQDYDNWLKAYHAIPDFRAELTSLDSWLSGQPAEKRKGWFHVASGSLNRKHQELLREDRKAGQQSADDEMPLC